MKVLNTLRTKELSRCSYKKDSFGVLPIAGKEPDFNLHGSHNAVVKSINNDSSEVTSSGKCCDFWSESLCCSKTPASPRHKDYHIDSASETLKQSANNAKNEADVVPRKSPSLKRPRSPDHMASSSKKKKIHSPQKNRIIRYLIQTDKTSNGQHTVTKVSKFDCENDTYSENYQSKNRNIKNESTKRTACKKPPSPVTITLSSDEENDPCNFVSNVKKKEISEEAISKLAKSLSAVSCHSKHLNDFDDAEKGNCPTSSLDTSSGKQNFQGVYFISSDEDEDICPSLQEKIVDLTCDDDSSFGDNIGDMFHEPKQEKKGMQNKEHSMHEDSYGLVKGKIGNDKEKTKGQKDDYDKFDVPVHNKNQLKNYVFSHGDFSMEFDPEYGSQNIFMENNSYSLYSPPSSYATKYNVELWKSNEENIILEKQDDINLPSPPTICKKSSLHDEESVKHSETVKKKPKIVKVNKIPKEKLKVGRHKKKTSKDSSSNDSGVEMFSEVLSNDNSGASSRVHQYKNNEKGPNAQISERSLSEHCENLSKIVYPSAGQVCKIHAQVLMSKLCQPWKDLGSHYIPDCCVHDPDECSRYHEMRQDLPEEVNGNDDTFILRMPSLTSAIDFLQRRIDAGSYPTSTIVQYIIVSAVDSRKDGVSSLVFCLRQLLREHPPCKTGMLEYYKKIFFTPVQKMDAPNGIFWWCMNKINDLIKPTKNVPAKKLEDAEATENINSVHATLSFSEEVTELAFSTKLKELFCLLEFIIDVMEADLNVGLIKNMSDLKSYTAKSTRPLIAVALWNGHGIAGPVNAKCKELIEMYFIIFESYRNTIYFQYFKRLISLIAGVVYACERNTSPPEYPNIGHHCQEFTNAFSSAMITAGLNMVDVQIVLKFLKPDWFRFCVCSNLLEKLYGRNMDVSLQPVISLLKNLCAINQKFPSHEDLSHTILGETESNNTVKNSCVELSPNFVKNATKKDKKGETRLHIACRRNNVTELENLLRVPNINVNEKDNMGWTPLHEAAFHGSTECLKLLLNFRTPAGGPAVDLRMRNSYGVTPLMDAVSRNHLEIAFQLLQHGGPEILLDKNDQDKSPFDLANTEEMKNILRNIPEESIYTDFVTIPRTLYIQLAVLSPLAILFYIQFSEVLKIASALEKGTKLKRHRESAVKFQAVMFKQDYLDVKELQSLVEKISKCNSKLKKQLVFLM